ncbi:hypothetical protein C2U70_25195 [Bradyrhizobium guangdongense]|uniref:hypothetical protein n=1 Tax=Bradyrhizobium guangdongense TaxID=1325090 RepID=UPI00112D0D47|nr:hypothetical protein [Bradyrhizobium guangdongense]TPQ30990.1 hypothetical protein C2U70_25195 [Bradyrhizobium guangdongense]
MASAYGLLGLFRLLTVGLAYLTGPQDQLQPARNLEAAWQVLAPCAETVSFDGAWTMSLNEHGGAIVNSDRHGQRLQGHWELLDAKAQSYRIDVLAFGNDFVVVPTAAGCLLGSGTLHKVDLKLSWFMRDKPDREDLVASVSPAHVTMK